MRFVSRRTIISGAGAALVPGVHARTPGTALYAGGYAAEGNPGALPLHLTSAGQWRSGSAIPEARDASFGVEAPSARLHYLLEERDDGYLSTWSSSGERWQRRSRVSTQGASPCHLALDRSGSALAVANYASGSVMLVRLDRSTGLPTGPGELRQHVGSGPVKDRQEAPHAHWVGFSPDNRWLWAVDLGADAIFAHAFNASGVTLGGTKAACRLDPGCGPRHMALHPLLPRAYVVTELSNSILTLQAKSDATFEVIGRISTLPAGYSGKSYAAEITIDPAGRHLYVSNRGHDSIAVFAIDQSGALSPVQHVACGGHWPRHIRLLDDGRRLLVANQRSGDITAFVVGGDGHLRPQGAAVRVPGVAFIGLAD